MQSEHSELQQRKTIPVEWILRKGFVSPNPLMNTDLPWITDSQSLRPLASASRAALLEIPSKPLGGILRVVVAEHTDGRKILNVILGIASDRATSDDPRPAYHPFTSRHFANSVRRWVEKEDQFKDLVQASRGKKVTPRRYTLLDIHFPPSSVHGELFRQKKIEKSVRRVPAYPTSKIIWKSFRVVRFEVPGIQNNVPVVIANYSDRNGKTKQAAIGVAAVGNRIIASSDRCPAHHRFLDVKMVKLLQDMIYRPRRTP